MGKLLSLLLGIFLKKLRKKTTPFDIKDFIFFKVSENEKGQPISATRDEDPNAQPIPFTGETGSKLDTWIRK